MLIFQGVCNPEFWSEEFIQTGPKNTRKKVTKGPLSVMISSNCPTVAGFGRQHTFFLLVYTEKLWHTNIAMEYSPVLIGNTSSKGPFSIAMFRLPECRHNVKFIYCIYINLDENPSRRFNPKKAVPVNLIKQLIITSTTTS